MTTLQLRAFREALKNYNAIKANRRMMHPPNLGSGNNAWRVYTNAWREYDRRFMNYVKEVSRKRAIVRRIGNKLGMTVYRNASPYNERRRKNAHRRYLGRLISSAVLNRVKAKRKARNFIGTELSLYRPRSGRLIRPSNVRARRIENPFAL
jgi:hypothetical protein